MHRIDSTTKKVDAFGSGKHGFVEGTAGIEAPTEITDDWMNGVQEEIVNVVEDTGGILAKGTRTQLTTAIKKMLKMHSVANWKHITNAQNDNLRAAATDGADIYMAVGEITPASDPYIMVSTNGGVSWNESVNLASKDLYGIAHNGTSLFCAVGETDGVDALIMTTITGSPWTVRGAGTLANLDLNGVAHDQSGLWCAVGNSDGADAYVVTSPGGTTWTKRGTGALDNLDLFAVAHNGAGLWCAVGGTDADPYIITSADAITWTRRESGNFPGGYALRAVIYDSYLGLWIAAGENGFTSSGPFLITSSDAITWTDRTPTPEGNILGMATDGAGLIIATGNKGSPEGLILTSTDGLNWIDVLPSTDDFAGYNGVAYGNRLWVIGGDAVGAESALMKSHGTYF